MQIGVIGLGRRGANISRRLMQAGHSCVVWDANSAAVQGLGNEGAQAASSLRDAVQALKERPRAVWVMLPAGRITEQTIMQLEDSSEGRWTVEAAIEEAVPADVLDASLFMRFRSRQEHTFAEKVLSAMRFGFGGHVELPAP
jgi:6-phosphogluconate dehydrogenase (decarboxylating)